MFTSDEIYYRSGVLTCEDLPLTAVAEKFGTPAYIYSKSAILRRFESYRSALADIPHKICFAVKANSNLAVLHTLARAGSGFDIVSGGELYRVLAAGASASSVVFSGVGKTDEEISFALEQKIHSFNCESEAEIHRISSIAKSMGAVASIALRVNPDVDAVTHPYISTGLREHKFGVAIEEAEAIYSRIAKLPGLKPESISCHIGSQLMEVRPLLEAADKVLGLVGRLRSRGFPIQYLDLGGGVGVPYRSNDQRVAIADFIGHLRTKVEGWGLTLMLEPGRSIVAEAGLLLCRVVATKRNGTKSFVIVDAAMNDLIRPSLYQAHHEIIPVIQTQASAIEVDIVGPVCETGDFFARGRFLPEVEPGDLLAIQTTGAYGFVLASNYNSRPRVCELLIERDYVHVARERETFADLVRGEHLPQ